jgi:hypothetical protein
MKREKGYGRPLAPGSVVFPRSERWDCALSLGPLALFLDRGRVHPIRGGGTGMTDHWVWDSASPDGAG